jgi:hypothetical protein
MATHPTEIKKNRKNKYPSKENQHTNYLHPFTGKLQIQMQKDYKHKQIVHGLLQKHITNLSNHQQPGRKNDTHRPRGLTV